MIASTASMAGGGGRRHLEIDIEEPLASATRTWKRHGRQANPDLRVLRPTGTG